MVALDRSLPEHSCDPYPEDRSASTKPGHQQHLNGAWSAPIFVNYSTINLSQVH